MNPHLKLAYDYGVNSALEEAGIDKEAYLGLKMNLAARLMGEQGPESARVQSRRYADLLYRNAKAGKAVGLGATAATYPLAQEKRAFINITTPKERKEARNQGLLYGAGAEIAAVPLLGIPAATMFNKSLAKGETTPQQAQKLVDALGLHKQYGSDGSLQRNSEILLDSRGGARFELDSGNVHINKALKQATPDILAHELGHATMQNKGLLNRLRRGSMRSFYQYSPLLALTTLGATHVTDPNSDNPYLIPALGAAAQAPKVLEEGLASAKAMKALRQTGDFSEAVLKQMRRRLGKAGLTYLAAGLGAAAAPFAMRYGQRKKLEE